MRRILIITLFASLLFSCQDAKIDEAVNNTQSKEYIYANIGKEDTRVELNNYKQTVWSAGDMIIRLGDNIHDVWVFEGETGDRYGKFSKYGSFNNLVDHNFNGKYFSLYPYKDNFYAGTSTFTNGDLALFFHVEGVQQYQPNSYDRQSNIMLGIGRDAENYTFQNIMGYLRLSLTGDKKVESIILKGNNDEILSGLRYVHQEDVNISDWYEYYGTSITLNCGEEGVQLTDIPTDFYFTIIPTLFSEGIDIQVLFTDGTRFPIKTTKEINIERNCIQPMATVETGDDVNWQTIIIKHSGNTISAPLLYGQTNLSGYVYWNDGWMSNINVFTSYVFEDDKSEHEVVVKALNANYLYIDGCTGISEIDLTNF